MTKAKYKINVHLILRQGEAKLTLTGREAWAMQALAEAGSKGCTPINRPAPRWSAYIHTLRKRGIDIETIHEPHGGTFSGTHGRYILHSQVVSLEVDEAQGGSK